MNEKLRWYEHIMGFFFIVAMAALVYIVIIYFSRNQNASSLMIGSLICFAVALLYVLFVAEKKSNTYWFEYVIMTLGFISLIAIPASILGSREYKNGMNVFELIITIASIVYLLFFGGWMRSRHKQ